MAKKRPKYEKGSWNEPIYPGSEVDLENGGIRRYRIEKAEWEEVVTFFEACFANIKAAIHTRTEDPSAGPCFQCGIGPKCPEPFDFEALLVMYDPQTRKKKKRKPIIQVYVTSSNVPEDFGKESEDET